jgi:hypothetical protein
LIIFLILSSGSAALAVVSSLDFTSKLEPRERYKEEPYEKIKSYRIPRTNNSSSSKYPPPPSSGQKHSYYMDTGGSSSRAFARTAETDLEMDMGRGSGASAGGRGYVYGGHHHQRYPGAESPPPPPPPHIKSAAAAAYSHAYALPKTYAEAEEKQHLQQQQQQHYNMGVSERQTTAAGSNGGGDYNKHHYLVEGERDYISSYEKYGLPHEKPDYSGIGSLDKTGGGPYSDYGSGVADGKNHLLSGGGEPEDNKQQQQIYHHGHHHQSLPPVNDGGRLLQSRDGSYGQSLDPRLLSSSLIPSADLRPNSMFLDAGPADLTMSSKDLLSASSSGRSDGRSDLSLYCGGGGGSSPPRHLVAPSHYRHQQRAGPNHGQRNGGLSGSGGPSADPAGRHYPDSGRSHHHYISPRSAVQPPPAELYRESRMTTASQEEPGLLLDDAAYRSLQDLGYAVGRPTANHYYDQLDAFFHPSAAARSLDMDDSYEKQQQQQQRQPKYVKQEKYFRGSEERGQQEGGLLPPLLALVPSLPPGGHAHHPPPASPPKMDYLCNPGDHLSAQYLPDGAMDYY